MLFKYGFIYYLLMQKCQVLKNLKMTNVRFKILLSCLDKNLKLLYIFTIIYLDNINLSYFLTQNKKKRREILAPLSLKK